MHQPLRRREHDEKIVEAHDAVDGRSEFENFFAQIGREQRTRHNVKRKVHHVGGNVAPFAVAPGIAHTHSLFDNGAGIFRNTLAVKCGLRR